MHASPLQKHSIGGSTVYFHWQGAYRYSARYLVTVKTCLFTPILSSCSTTSTSLSLDTRTRWHYNVCFFAVMIVQSHENGVGNTTGENSSSFLH